MQTACSKAKQRWFELRLDTSTRRKDGLSIGDNNIGYVLQKPMLNGNHLSKQPNKYYPLSKHEEGYCSPSFNRINDDAELEPRVEWLSLITGIIHYKLQIPMLDGNLHGYGMILGLSGDYNWLIGDGCI